MIRAKTDYARYRDTELPATLGTELHRLPVYPAGMMAEPFVNDLAVQLEKFLNNGIEAAKSTELGARSECTPTAEQWEVGT